MPVISFFYGVTILMYYFDNKRHKLPHIHVEHGSDEAVISIPDGDVLEGKLRSREMKLVQAWVEIHADELMINWERAIAGENVEKIEALR